MCDADEKLEQGGQRVSSEQATTKMPFHEWVIAKVRLHELQRRRTLAVRGLIRPVPDAAEQDELVRLEERYKSKDETAYAVLHLAEAIAGGVIIPDNAQEHVRAALMSWYRCSNLDELDRDVQGAVAAALATLGVPESELPSTIAGDPEEAADDGKLKGFDFVGGEKDVDDLRVEDPDDDMQVG